MTSKIETVETNAIKTNAEDHDEITPVESTRGKKRGYNRRSDQERIADLEAKIRQIKDREARKNQMNDPVLKDIPKIQKRLRKFAQMAMDNERVDIGNMTMAFVAGLERVLRSN